MVLERPQPGSCEMQLNPILYLVFVETRWDLSAQVKKQYLFAKARPPSRHLQVLAGFVHLRNQTMDVDVPHLEKLVSEPMTGYHS